MRVYQAAWDVSGELVIWGEKASTFNDLITSNGNGSFDETDETPVHPFSCSQQQIDDDISLLEFAPDYYKTIEVKLPSDHFGPQPSPRLAVANELDRDQSPSLRRWKVTAAVFKSYPAACFLTSIPAENPVGIKFDNSVGFWIETIKFVLEILCHGHFIPTIKQDQDIFHASWQIVPSTEKEQLKLNTLASGLPGICQGFLQEKTGDSFNNVKLIETFIDIIGDSLIRTFLKNYHLYPQSQLRITSPKALVALEWLTSLSNPQSEITAPYNELIELDQKIKQWTSRLLSSVKKLDLKTAFQLHVPDPAEIKTSRSAQAKWKVDFFLFHSFDKSVTLYPFQIWMNDLGFLKNSEFTADQLEEILFKDLGKASTVFPQLKELLFNPYPNSINLSTEEAYTFLKVTAALLEQAGYEVILPDWWKTPKVKIGLHLSVLPSNEQKFTGGHKSFIGINQLLDCSWSVMLGDRKVSVEDFKNLVSKNTSLLAINGQWVEVNPEKVEATLAFLEDSESNQKMTILEALRIGYGVHAEEETLPVVGFSSDGWIKQLINAAAEGVPKLEQPSTFIGTLRHYQQDGLSWLNFLSSLGIGCCLADDMGLGKTIQLLVLLLTEKLSRPQDLPHEPNLLIVPMSILDNWQNEAMKFTPEVSTYVHHGNTRLAGEDFVDKAYSVDLVITTYSLAYRDEESLNKVNWNRITLDEAQNIKNLGTKQTQAIRKLVYNQLHSPERSTICHRLGLTGTPLENHLEELWSIMDFLNPSYLGSLRSFRSNYAIPIERYRNKDAAVALAQVIKPFILRRLKTDPNVISDLPEKIEMIEYTSLTEEQAALYQKTVDSLLPQVDQSSGIHRKGLVLAAITKLKQICNHPSLILDEQGKLSNRSGKLARLEELLETILEADDKVLIFSQYAQMGTLLKTHLQERFGQEVLFLHGGLSKSVRVKLVDRFQKPEGPKIFVLSLKAGGFGLNLTEANQVIHFDQWWNPAVESQATDRAYRIGQKRNVQVRKFICKGTLEEKIAAMLTAKKGLADQIVGSTKNFITELSSNELRSLLQLTQQTIINEND